jgi:hypothetical protein
VTREECCEWAEENDAELVFLDDADEAIVGIVVDALNEVREQEEIEHSDIEREFSKLEEQMASVKRLLKKSAEKDEAKKPSSDETKC